MTRFEIPVSEIEAMGQVMAKTALARLALQSVRSLYSEGWGEQGQSAYYLAKDSDTLGDARHNTEYEACVLRAAERLIPEKAKLVRVPDLQAPRDTWPEDDNLRTIVGRESIQARVRTLERHATHDALHRLGLVEQVMPQKTVGSCRECWPPMHISGRILTIPMTERYMRHSRTARRKWTRPPQQLREFLVMHRRQLSTGIVMARRGAWPLINTRLYLWDPSKTSRRSKNFGTCLQQIVKNYMRGMTYEKHTYHT